MPVASIAQVRFAKTLVASMAQVRFAKTPSTRAASKARDQNSRALRARRQAALRVHRNVSLRPPYFVVGLLQEKIDRPF